MHVHRNESASIYHQRTDGFTEKQESTLAEMQTEGKCSMTVWKKVGGWEWTRMEIKGLYELSIFFVNICVLSDISV